MSHGLRSLVAVAALGLVGCGGGTPSPPAPPAPPAPVPVAVGPNATGGPSCPGLEEIPAAPRAPAPPGCAPLPAPIDSVRVAQVGGVPWQESLTYGPGGGVFAIASRDGAIRIWDGRTAQLRQTLRGQRGHVRPVSFQPSGSALASTCGGQDVWLWDLETGRSRELLDAGAPFYDVDFSPDGAHLVTSHDAGLRLWRAAGARVAELPTRGEGHTFGPDSSVLATFVNDVALPQRLTLWQVATGARLWSLERRYVGQGAKHAAFRADGRAIAWLPDDRSVEVVDVATGAVARRLRGERRLSWVGWNGAEVFAIGSEGQLFAWDAGGVRRSLAGDDCRGCGFLPDPLGTHALARRQRGDLPVEARLFDLSGRTPPRELKLPFDPRHYAAWHPDGRHMAILSRRDVPAVIDVVSADTQMGVASVRDAWTVAWSPNGDALSSVHGHETTIWEDQIRIWDASSGALRSTVPGRTRGKGDTHDAYTHVAWSPGGDVIAALSMRHLDLYQPSGRFERNVETRAKYPAPQAMAFSDDGRRLALVAADLETVRIYDPRGGKVAEHNGRVGNLFAVAFSPDRKRIALGGGREIGVLDADTGRSVAVVEGSARGVNAIAWLDRDTFFSAHEDGSILRVEVGGTRTVVATHRGAIRALALSADKKLLATGSVDGDLEIRRTDDMHLLSTHGLDLRGVQAIAWHPRAPVVAVVAHGPIRLLRATDGTWINLHLLHVGPGETCAGLAVALGDLFNGNEPALSYVRWVPGDHRASAPMRGYDAFPAYRRETLGADLARGCPLVR